MDVRQIADSDRDDWNRFVAGYPSGDLLQSFEWGVVKSGSGGWEPIRIMVFDDDRPVAAVSILKRKLPRLNKSILYAPRGPVGDLSNPELLANLTRAVRDLAGAHSAILFKIDPPVPVEDGASESNLRDFAFRPVGDASGFGGTQPKCVMQLDITKEPDALMAEFKPKTRYNIRLAQKKGVTVEQGADKTDLRRFYDLLLETAARDRFLIRSYGYFETLWDTLVAPGYARLFLAKYQSEPIAGVLCFYFGDRCWYTYGASSNAHRNVMPNHLVQWRAIEHARSLGIRLYDFRGVSPRRGPTPQGHLQGLNRFKEGFGARYVEYIGDYDLPLSTHMYWMWRASAPVIALLKSWKRARAPEPADV